MFFAACGISPYFPELPHIMNITKCFRYLGALALFSCVSLSAVATQSPVYDTFGSIPGATFGGTGIPNDAVAFSWFGEGGRVGLTATARYSNPTVTNDGAGLFSALAGIDQTNAGSIATQLARWNFGFYINDAGTNSVYNLFMDIDPTTGENFKSWGPAGVGTSGVSEDSWNLGFNSFEAGLGYSFDPTVDGEYTFMLTASSVNGAPLASTSIVVQVGAGSSVPEPGSLALLGVALAAVGASRRRKI